ADIRGTIPLAFNIGANLVNVVDATKLKNRILAMLAAATSSLWRLSNGSRRGIPARPTHANAVNTITIVALAAQSSQGLTVNSATMPAGPSVLTSVIVSNSRFHRRRRRSGDDRWT